MRDLDDLADRIAEMLGRGDELSRDTIMQGLQAAYMRGRADTGPFAQEQRLRRDAEKWAGLVIEAAGGRRNHD